MLLTGRGDAFAGQLVCVLSGATKRNTVNDNDAHDCVRALEGFSGLVTATHLLGTAGFQGRGVPGQPA